MKTYIKIIVTFLVGVSLFNGCASSSATIVKNLPKTMSKEVEITKDKNNVYSIYTHLASYKIKKFDNLDREDRIREKDKMLFNIAYKNAVAYGKNNGYKYMAIVNKGINNLSGFSLNTKDSMLSYIDLLHKNHFRPKLYKANQGDLYSNGRCDLKVVYFKNKLPGIFLFKL